MVETWETGLSLITSLSILQSTTFFPMYVSEIRAPRTIDRGCDRRIAMMLTLFLCRRGRTLTLAIKHILLYYRMAGNFRGVLIFVVFVVDPAATKISTHENL